MGLFHSGTLDTAVHTAVPAASYCCLKSIDSASPFLNSDDEQVIEEEEVDGVELWPHVEDGSRSGHFLQLPFLLQVSRLGDDRDALEETSILSKSLSNPFKINVQGAQC